jgi:pyruvate/2-oxoglutarate dehydrogenase complex dihydrolipoamide acyltransferase (E2) component
MASTRVKLPNLGDSAEAVVVEWHVAAGDQVEVEQALVTVETDKVDTDVPSPVAGTVVELLAEPGSELHPGDPICVIET